MSRDPDRKLITRIVRWTLAGRRAGFSLLELMAAVAVFVVVSGVALNLFYNQQPLFKQQQGQAGLNIGLRNAVAQLQMDMVNGGSGDTMGANMPSWPVGVTIVNNVQSSGSCYSSGAYTTDCFDQLNILVADRTKVSSNLITPIHATDSTGGSGSSNCSNTSTGTAYGQPATGLTVAQTAASYLAGNQLLFLSSNGSTVTTAVLTSNAVAVGSAVRFTFNPTNANGTNSQANDPLAITWTQLTSPDYEDVSSNNVPHKETLAIQFCGPDWIVKLAPIIYTVNTANSANPQLTRTQSGSSAVVMEQIIGFKVGASVWNDTNASTNSQYYYAASTYPTPYDFSLVRSVRVSIIGRTVPSTNPSYSYRNSFDNGPYQIQGASVVVNPRNLSMND
jgi:prepilin-type N-terminal cleavage/methylation domain-containing protein